MAKRPAPKGLLDWRNPSGRPPAGENRFRGHEVVVEYRAGTPETIIAGIAATVRLEELQRHTSFLRGTQIVRYRIADGASPDDAIRRLERDPRVAFAQPNYAYELVQAAAAATTDGPQYAFSRLHLADAHRRATGRNVRVAIIDSGIDTKHADFGTAAIEEFDALGEADDPATADRIHGTAIAGIIVARGTLQGTAPDAEIIGVRAFARRDNKVSGDSYSIARGVDFAGEHQARIINMSFAGPRDPLLERLIGDAIAKGLIVVAAVGNGGRDAEPAYPGAYAPVIAVTATGADDTLYANANRGAYVDLAAPGVDLLTLAPGNGYDISSGTSLASAHMSALIALLLERRPQLGPEKAAALLNSIAVDLGDPGRDDAFGNGLPDVLRALDES
ncbi:MAG: S8 family serine peptidase [Hyphomicrobiales bacterium]|nr:S8 family serine peptidase [Hyphomicrobiales bacterium]